MKLRITYGPWGESLAEMVEAGVAAEAAGAEVLWVPELHRSATISAAALAQATSVAEIGTAIALAFTRSPMITALEALDLDELSAGRFILGLGTGVQRLNEKWHNARWGKPASHLKETVRNIREFIAVSHTGEPMDLAGEYEPMSIRGYERPFVPFRPAIPIYLAAMGKGMTRLAGEVGDGWISHELGSPEYLEQQLLPSLREGMQLSGRIASDFDIVVSALCSIDSDGNKARRWAAGTVGFYASVKTYEEFFEWHGLAPDQLRVLEEFSGGAGADYLADFVSDEMVGALTLAGNQKDVVKQLMRYDGLATTVKLTPPTHGVKASETRKCQEQIIEMIKGLVCR